jgi:hypothetical protein
VVLSVFHLHGWHSTLLLLFSSVLGSEPPCCHVPLLTASPSVQSPHPQCQWAPRLPSLPPPKVAPCLVWERPREELLGLYNQGGPKPHRTSTCLAGHACCGKLVSTVIIWDQSLTLLCV